jgi:hypothetical protein
MCLICEKIKNNTMTLNEARKNIMELRILDHMDVLHYDEVIDIIKEHQKKEDDKISERVLKNK